MDMDELRRKVRQVAIVEERSDCLVWDTWTLLFDLEIREAIVQALQQRANDSGAGNADVIVPVGQTDALLLAGLLSGRMGIPLTLFAQRVKAGRNKWGPVSPVRRDGKESRVIVVDNVVNLGYNLSRTIECLGKVDRAEIAAILAILDNDTAPDRLARVRKHTNRIASIVKASDADFHPRVCLEEEEAHPDSPNETGHGKVHLPWRSSGDSAAG